MSVALIAVLCGHTEGRVWHLTWSLEGNFLASCGEDKIIRIWSFKATTQPTEDDYEISCISTLEDGQSRTIRSCEWSHGGDMIASASFDGTVFLWQCVDNNKSTWEKLATLEGHDNEVKSVAWNCDDSRLATCGRDKKIWIWEILPGGEFECLSVLEGHTQDVKFLIWHPNESTLFSASYDDTIRVWRGDDNDEEWSCSQTLKTHKSTVWGLSLSNTGNQFVSCSDDRSLALWTCIDPRKSEYGCSATAASVHKGPIYSVHLQDNICASVGGDNSLSIHSITNDTLTFVCGIEQAHIDDVNCVRWNPNNQHAGILATCGDDSFLKIWKYIQ